MLLCFAADYDLDLVTGKKFLEANLQNYFILVTGVLCAP